MTDPRATAAETRIADGYRYLCLDCPGSEIRVGELGPDGECRCPLCGEVMTAFDVVECRACGEWASVEDGIRFWSSHVCPAPPALGKEEE